MMQTAKLFTNGRSQAVRLPREFRFEETEVYIRRDASTGDVILSRKPASLDRFFELLREGVDVPQDFLSPDERHVADDLRDPFAGWQE
ncbi:antitoxin [Ottowia testudinis]|uniref:AbrB/MazE/SpoVT family DNA-binding domain-containing protein n=1 Tax=Ottowia testudinis TaxID=2816950 RepID=A0A975CK75_9BURK|nr:AbrB/MazE/SpoVT family DNA-binding domain-containing protein [Ottowia testudinis]QTD47124.1 AbrB/MazE/SpoVT family DNA-binding domain-containing protein [Ottowia testudinis]